MRLSVVGRWAPLPKTGGACAGYLLEEAGTRVLVDCGHAVSTFLGRFVDYNDLDAIVLTHLHDDHHVDVLALRQGLRIDLVQGRRQGPMPVYTLEDPAPQRANLAMPGVLDLRGYAPGQSWRIGPFTVRTTATRHPLPCAALRFEAGGATFVFSADTAPTDALPELAAGADLLLCESSYLHVEDGPPDMHLTAAQAGDAARAAGVGRLLLTHLHPRANVPALVRAASRAFGQPCAAAREGRTYEI